MSEITLFVLASVSLFSLGTLVVFLLPLNKTQATHLSLTFALLGGLAAAYSAVHFWKQPMVSPEAFFVVEPFVDGLPSLIFELFVDPLAAFFLLLTGCISAGIALYSFIWLQDTQNRRRIAGLYNLFVLFTLLVIVANNAFFFLLFLECMTLCFSFLTLYKHNKLLERPAVPTAKMWEAKSAFKTYLIANHTGVVFVVASFVALAVYAGSFSFTSFRKLDLVGHPNVAGLIFLLALIGFGIKAAVTPSHPWLPVTHPFSPTNIHAMMSGVIIKVAGIYGMLRVFFEFLRPVPWWWGWLVLLLAGVTAVVGVFYAITSRDLKTALANHSVENIGIILAGMGLALIFAADEFANHLAIHGLAGLALTAALYHTLNHAIFKGLLFLCVGAIENRTGTVEMEELGGLIKRFPWTSATFLVGAVSIAGFPPFNGFVSEWLTLQSLFAGLELFTTSPGLWLLAGLVVTLLLLSIAFGLTALAFVKIVGETLLGAPRRAMVLAREQQGDVPWAMRGVLVILAIMCLLLGLFPMVVVDQLADVVCGLQHFRAGCEQQLIRATNQKLLFVTTTLTKVTVDVPPTPTEGGHNAGYTAMLQILPLLIPAATVVVVAALITTRRHKSGSATSPVWSCGSTYNSETMQITGGAFAFLVWEPAGGTTSFGSEDEKISLDIKPLPSPFRMSAGRYVTEFFRQSYNIALTALLRGSDYLGNMVQSGDVRHYLLYIFVAFLAVLAVLASS